MHMQLLSDSCRRSACNRRRAAFGNWNTLRRSLAPRSGPCDSPFQGITIAVSNLGLTRSALRRSTASSALPKSPAHADALVTFPHTGPAEPHRPSVICDGARRQLTNVCRYLEDVTVGVHEIHRQRVTVILVSELDPV